MEISIIRLRNAFFLFDLLSFIPLFLIFINNNLWFNIKSDFTVYTLNPNATLNTKFSRFPFRTFSPNFARRWSHKYVTRADNQIFFDFSLFGLFCHTAPRASESNTIPVTNVKKARQKPCAHKIYTCVLHNV